MPLTGAPKVWRGGNEGQGVKVAVLDTGCDAVHPGLDGRAKLVKNFTPPATADDKQGHGTHVAATVGGSGKASDGAYRGVAPGAELLIGKVLDDSGSGQLSGVVAGMQWAVDSGAEVVSMSLGNDAAEACEGPDTEAVRALSDRALFVIAAGNQGCDETVMPPGCAPEALTVGAVDRQGETASFSSQGPAIATHRA